jgi:copper transport protein
MGGAGLLLALLLWLAPFMAGVASAHALLVRSDPAANAVLTAPPSEVRLWFSEPVTPGLSTAVVVDPSNHEVDNHDAHVNPGNQEEIDVTLPTLAPGQYVVAWVTVSASDGHRVGGSFIFAIAAPNGVVPKAASLPTGHFPGAAGSASATFTLDPPTVLNIIAVWGVLLAALLLGGGLFWELVILAPAVRRAPNLAHVLVAATRRFRPLICWSLGVVLIFDLLLLVAQIITDAGGSLAGLADLPLLGSLLLSKFGIFWVGRQLVAIVMLLCLLGAGWWTQRASLGHAPRPALTSGPGALALEQPSSSAAAVRFIVRRNSVMLALAALLLLMIDLSGHAAAVTGSLGRYAVAVDWLHLAGAAIWLGGLFYIALVLLPVLPRDATVANRAGPLLALLPRFAPWALGCVVVVVLSGVFNTDAHIFYLVQMVTTPYGQTLTVKIVLASTMVGISYWHAFRLRPKLRRALATGDTPAAAALLRRVQRLLHIEPALGVGVILCVALLGMLAGTLALPQASYLSPPPGGKAGPVTESAIANQVHITLHVAPATFGDNTITVDLTTPAGAPIDGGSVFIEAEMLDMDMGTQTYVLKDTGHGVYTGDGQITMAGHWDYIVVVRTRANPNQLTQAQFRFIAY